MKGGAGRTSMRGMNARLATLATSLLLLAVPIVTSHADDGTRDEWVAEGGHEVLMEHYTATWCEICATVDPWMPDFTQANSGRVARVAMHDNFDDPMGTPITAHRAQLHSSIPSAPTFWFDGEIMLGGAPSRATLHMELLSSEGRRSDDTRMSLSVAELAEGILSISVELSELSSVGGRVSIFVLEDTVVIEPHQATNGITEHHDVVRFYSETSLDEGPEWDYPSENWGNSSHNPVTVTSSNSIVVTKVLEIAESVEVGGLRVVAVHESNTAEGNGVSTMGAVSVLLGNQAPTSRIALYVPIALVLGFSAFVTARSRQ